MNYFSKKEELSKKAHEDYERRTSQYAKEIQSSIERTKIYDDGILSKDITVATTERTTQFISNVDSVTSVFLANNASKMMGTQTDKICILNFASYKEPGGMYLNGSSAQEECLCHSSTLYPVLKAFQESYYDVNKQKVCSGLYTNKALYSPDIVFEEGNRTVKCDVLTCAAPNLMPIQRYHTDVSKERIDHTLLNRQNFVLKIAADNNVNVLILGAFGCGVFRNNPHDVAKNFMVLIHNYYTNVFRNVVYAVPTFGGKDMKNFNAFKTVALETGFAGIGIGGETIHG